MRVRDKLIADVVAQLNAKLDYLESVHAPGSVLVEIHLDEQGPRKVKVTENSSYEIPR